MKPGNTLNLIIYDYFMLFMKIAGGCLLKLLLYVALMNWCSLWIWLSSELHRVVWQCFRGACCPHHWSDDEGSNLLRNVGQYLPDYTVQHPRRQPLLYYLLCKPQMSPVIYYIIGLYPDVHSLLVWSHIVRSSQRSDTISLNWLHFSFVYAIVFY
jgi:hypothetical protein